MWVSTASGNTVYIQPTQNKNKDAINNKNRVQLLSHLSRAEWN